jgi:hypothetical protein
VVKRCPNDGGVISQVRQRCDLPVWNVLFFWCRYCKELFVFAETERGRSEFTASFIHDPAGGWRLCKSQGLSRMYSLQPKPLSRLTRQIPSEVFPVFFVLFVPLW